MRDDEPTRIHNKATDDFILNEKSDKFKRLFGTPLGHVGENAIDLAYPELSKLDYHCWVVTYKPDNSKVTVIRDCGNGVWSWDGEILNKK